MLHIGGLVQDCSKEPIRMSYIDQLVIIIYNRNDGFLFMNYEETVN